jgi:hypothetical protein
MRQFARSPPSNTQYSALLAQPTPAERRVQILTPSATWRSERHDYEKIRGKGWGQDFWTAHLFHLVATKDWLAILWVHSPSIPSRSDRGVAAQLCIAGLVRCLIISMKLVSADLNPKKLDFRFRLPLVDFHRLDSFPTRFAEGQRLFPFLFQLCLSVVPKLTGQECLFLLENKIE